jgi:hypothetical protein
MSDPRAAGPLSAIAAPIAEAAAKHQALPPNKKNADRAYGGGFICGTCAMLGPEVAGWPDEFKLGYALIFGWGLLLLVVGWRGSRGMRDPIGAVLAVAVPAIGFIAAVNYEPALLQIFYVQAFCVGVVTANVVRFVICVRGIGGNARKLVVNDINQGEWKW